MSQNPEQMPVEIFGYPDSKTNHTCGGWTIKKIVISDDVSYTKTSAVNQLRAQLEAHETGDKMLLEMLGSKTIAEGIEQLRSERDALKGRSEIAVVLIVLFILYMTVIGLLSRLAAWLMGY